MNGGSRHRFIRRQKPLFFFLFIIMENQTFVIMINFISNSTQLSIISFE